MRRSDRERQRAGDVEHAEVLGGAVLVRQHVGGEREVDGHVDAEAEPADGHADQEAVEAAGEGDDEHRQAVHGRRGEDEDLPAAGPVGQPAPEQGGRDDDGGLDEGAEEHLLRHVVLGGADLVQQVVRLVGRQERVGQHEQEAAGERPGEVRGLARVDVEGAGELAQRPRRLVGRGQPAVVQGGGEEQDEEPADRARDQEHGELVAGEQLDQEGAGHRRDRHADAEDAGDRARVEPAGPGRAGPRPGRRAAR